MKKYIPFFLAICILTINSCARLPNRVSSNQPEPVGKTLTPLLTSPSPTEPISPTSATPTLTLLPTTVTATNVSPTQLISIQTETPTSKLTQTSTCTITPSPIVPDEGQPKEECLSETTSLSSGLNINGSIILLPQGGSDRAYIVNFPTGVISYLPDDWDWSDWDDISPDGKLLARNRYRGNAKDFQDILGIDIMTISGDLLATVPWEAGWSGYGWGGNERF